MSALQGRLPPDFDRVVALKQTIQRTNSLRGSEQDSDTGYEGHMFMQSQDSTKEPECMEEEVDITNLSAQQFQPYSYRTDRQPPATEQYLAERLAEVEQAYKRRDRKFLQRRLKHLDRMLARVSAGEARLAAGQRAPAPAAAIALPLTIKFTPRTKKVAKGQPRSRRSSHNGAELASSLLPQILLQAHLLKQVAEAAEADSTSAAGTPELAAAAAQRAQQLRAMQEAQMANAAALRQMVALGDVTGRPAMVVMPNSTSPMWW